MVHRAIGGAVPSGAGPVRAAAAVALLAAALAWGVPAPAQEGESPPPTAPPEAKPPAVGSASEVEAKGWGDRTAAVLHVEGAVDGAPLHASQKPRPQNDWFVQRFRTSRPHSLNSFASNEPDAAAIAASTLGRLIDVDPDSPPALVPRLAVSWVVSDDGRTCTYYLRRGVQFADGRPFTSADVKFSFDVLRDADVTADHLRPSFESVAEVTAPAPHTVVVKFDTKHWKALYLVGHTLRVLNKAWYEQEIPEIAGKLGIDLYSTQPGAPGFADVFNRIRRPCPGTGAYYLPADHDLAADHVQLVQNPFSWAMQVHPERYNFTGIRWVDLSDETSEYDAFVHGGLDVWVVPHELWENQLSRDPRVAAVANHYVYDHIGIDCSALVWNCRKEPFDNRDVRVAMTHLVNRDWILMQLEQGHGSVAACKSKRGYPSYSADIRPHPFSPFTASALLRRAGWERKDESGLLRRKGRTFEFELLVPAGRRFFALLGDRVRRSFRASGIGMTVVPVDSAEFLHRIHQREFDAICGFSSWPDPWIDLYAAYHSSQAKVSGGNVSGWSHAKVDQLLEDMRQELDEDKRTALFHEFNRLFHLQQPETLLVHGKVGVLLQKRFRNASIRPTGLQSFDLWVRPEDVRHK